MPYGKSGLDFLVEFLLLGNPDFKIVVRLS
jgi:hypothetical protein